MTARSVDYALIGGGLAAVNCARWLREGGAEGSILLIGREIDLPYDRPVCSKGYLQGTKSREQALLHPPEWFAEHRIEALTRVSALKLDLESRTLKLSNKEEVAFGKALVATGANVRRLNVPGSELEGIHYLRTLGNSDAIRQDAAGKRVVLIGGSYIGSEVAATLTELGSECSIVMLEDVILSRGFGMQAGRFLQDRLQEHGIAVHGGEELERFEGADGRVTRVVTKGGLELDADAVVVGAGAVPDVMLARAAGLELGPAAASPSTRGSRQPCPGSTPPETVPSTRASSTTGHRSGSSTGTSRSATVGRLRATCWLLTLHTMSCRISSPTFPTGRRSNMSDLRASGIVRSCAGRWTRERSASSTLPAGG